MRVGQALVWLLAGTLPIPWPQPRGAGGSGQQRPASWGRRVSVAGRLAYTGALRLAAPQAPPCLRALSGNGTGFAGDVRKGSHPGRCRAAPGTAVGSLL